MRNLVQSQILRIMLNHHVFNRIIVSVAEVYPMGRHVVEIIKTSVSLRLYDQQGIYSLDSPDLLQLAVQVILNGPFQAAAIQILPVYSMIVYIREAT